MSDKHTPEERAILASWPTVTSGDIQRMNALFPHYLFFRPEKTGVRFWTSCCGQVKFLESRRRTEYPWDRELMGSLKHNAAHFCPWCGRAVTMKDLRKAGKRHMLNKLKYTLLLHATEEALYADAVVLNKSYGTEADLTAPPTYWLSSGYRFALGDVMQADYQVFGDKAWISHERDRLGRRKLVQEPFKEGSISWFRYEPYSILNVSALKECPVTRYSRYFQEWKGDCQISRDFVSYMTAYCIYPRQIEMLVKAGFHEPVRALIENRKKFSDAICWEEPDIRKAMNLTAPELREVLERKPPMLALELRNLVQRWFSLRCTVREAVDFLQTWGEGMARYFLSFCRHYHLDPRRLSRYLEENCVVDPDLTWRDITDVFTEYRDYLEAAYLLGSCLDHSRVLFPEDLQTAHDRATAQLLERRAPAAEKAAANGAARMKKYSFELDGLRIVFPLTAASIRREGKVLDHCVGGYAERHIKGVLTILFLRKTSAPNTPYVTIEMDGNRIRQIHGYGNERSGGESPRKVHKEFLDTWLAWLKTGSRRDRDGKPVLPKVRQEARSA